MAQYTYTPGQSTYNQYGGQPANVSLDHLRREFVGDMLYALSPQESQFFSMLSRYKKKGWHDPVFKSMEKREQWQRRNFELSSVTNDTTLVVKCDYDRRGKKNVASTDYLHACYFILPNSVLQIGGITVGGKNGVLTVGVSANTNKDMNGSADGDSTLTVQTLYHIADDGTKTNNPSSISKTSGFVSKGLVSGSAFSEGSGKATGFADVLGQTEGYMQIFKTANDMWTGTMLATEYRGVKDEAKRQWMDKMREHKMDINHALMYGVGRIATSSGAIGSDQADARARRYTWGIIPYLQHFGSTESFHYSTTGFDDFVDFLGSYMDPTEGTGGPKLCLASRKIMTWLNKIEQGGSLLGNTFAAKGLNLDFNTVTNELGFKMTKVSTTWGDIYFTLENLIKGPFEDYAVMLEMNNINYKYLNGNGYNRDTHIEYDVQDKGTDGKIDQLLTEAGLEIVLPETHRLLSFK